MEVIKQAQHSEGESMASHTLRYTRAKQNKGRCAAFFSKKCLLAPRKGPRQAIKPIELYGSTRPFFAEVLPDFCKKPQNVPYGPCSRSCPYIMYGDLQYGYYMTKQYLSTDRYSFVAENAQFRRFYSWLQLAPAESRLGQRSS